MLAMEKSLVYASERVTALGQDKDRAVERRARAQGATRRQPHRARQNTGRNRILAQAAGDRRGSVARRDRQDPAGSGEPRRRHGAGPSAELAQLGNERQAAEAAREEQIRDREGGAWRWTMPRSWRLSSAARRTRRGHGRPPRRRVDPDAARTGKAVAALKEESSAQLAARSARPMKRLWRPRSATTRTKSRPCAAALKTSWLPVKQSASAI